MLAATVKGRAAEGLIDSYEIERHPVAAAVLEWTRVQVTTLIPDLFGEAAITSSPESGGLRTAMTSAASIHLWADLRPTSSLSMDCALVARWKMDED